jgi:hypothetical protein
MMKTQFKAVLATLAATIVAGCAGASLRVSTLDAAPPQSALAA